ncbi:MAG: ABC transporter permease [Phycisphaerales bacterium]
MTTLWQDVRYGLRMLAKSPGFTAVVVVILGVGIGVNTAVFSVVNAVMLRPLPYKAAHRLVCVWEHSQWGDFPPSQTALPLCREQKEVFEQVAGLGYQSPYVTGIDKARQVRAAAISHDFLALLGLQPMLGRGFLAQEEQLGNDCVVILSHGFWQSDFGGAPDVVGRTVNLDDKSCTIIGVLPPAVEPPLGRTVAFWKPLVFKTSDPSVPLGEPVFVWARLKRGVTLEQSRAAVSVIAGRLKTMDPEMDHALTVLRPLDRYLEGKRRLLLLVLGAAGFVLLIVCGNVASLFLARAAVRQREMAIRTALGASRGRVVRQLLTEGLLLSVTGGVLGLLLTFGTMQGLVRLYPTNIPRLEETCVDVRVLAFTLAVSLLTSLLFAAAPAWRASGGRMAKMLKEGTARSSGGHVGRRFHGGLVVTQMGLSLILLVGAALLIRSMIALYVLDLGFRPENMLAVTFDLPQMKYPEPRQCQAFFESLLPRVRALPLVRSAGLSLGELGLGYAGVGGVGIRIPGRSYADDHRDPTLLSHVSVGFLETLGVPCLKGRTFTGTDIYGQGNGIIIDEHLARKQFGDTDPIGQQVDFPDSRHVVVGVVGTVKDFQNLEPDWGTIYAPIPQAMWLLGGVVIVRTDGDPMHLIDPIRAEVAELETDEVIRRVETVEAILSRMLAQRRFAMILLSLFAGIALVLAAVGVYGLLHYGATQRTREIAIRMALGAERANVQRMVLGHGLRLTLLGVVLGLAGAMLLTRVLSSLLYDVTPTDPPTLVLVSCVLTVIALLASYIPAWRAARVDPMVALRCE